MEFKITAIKKEQKYIYILDVGDTNDFFGMPDEEYIKLCREKGYVYSLEEFQKKFNKAELDFDLDETFLRII